MPISDPHSCSSAPSFQRIAVDPDGTLAFRLTRTMTGGWRAEWSGETYRIVVSATDHDAATVELSLHGTGVVEQRAGQLEDVAGLALCWRKLCS